MEKTESVEENEVSLATKTKSPKKFIYIILGALALLLLTFLLIHFTNLRYKSRIDLVGSVIYKTKSVAATSDKERANFHISESERLVSEVQKSTQSGGHYTQNMKPYEKMIYHNAEATKYMLAAEAGGVDLREQKLIKRLCDSLGAQYALITNTSPEDIPEGSKLNTRVANGEELQYVFEQIQFQLQKAMNW